MQIPEIGDRRTQFAANRPICGLEADFITHVVGRSVSIIVDVYGVSDSIVEIKVIGSVAWILTGINVHNKGNSAISWLPVQICFVITDESINIRVVGRRIKRDKGRFAVARRVRWKTRKNRRG